MSKLKISKQNVYKKLIAGNMSEYGDAGDEIAFITPEKADQAELERATKLGHLIDKLQWTYKNTKPYLHDLSPGCRICGNGGWSCLFINGKCNCRCFYCPSPQDDISVPTTNRLVFDTSNNYVDYIHHFNFNGVSFSGGEPLLTFERTLDYIRTVRRNGPDDLYIWMYTNGSLMTPDHIRKLKDAGLSEIRFDIGATDYDLKKLRMAIGHIPVVTVEIPAVPEDLNRFPDLVPILADNGVNYLNLHQLRLTPHNMMHLKKRNYTFLHGEKVTILESELAVLDLFKTAVDQGWTLPINYCSFTYKHQFQRAAARKRSALVIAKPYEALTESGFIRTIVLMGAPARLELMAREFSRQEGTRELFQLSGNKSQMFIHETLWPNIDFSGLEVGISYSEAVLSPALSYRHAFKEIRLDGGMKLFVEKQNRTRPIVLAPDEADLFYRHAVLKNHSGAIDPDGHEWIEYEFIREGLQKYF